MRVSRADIVIGVIDVGSPKGGKLGWAILAPNTAPRVGKDLDTFIHVMTELGTDWPLAVGFEAPLFIATRTDALSVLTARKGEGSRPWSAGAGASVMTAALGVVTYTLAGLRRGLANATATTDANALPTKAGDTFFFEAFVTAEAKGADHTDDALVAAHEIKRLFSSNRPYRSAINEADVFSLLGASLLRTNWSTDLSLLSTPCLVVKPGFDHLV